MSVVQSGKNSPGTGNRKWVERKQNVCRVVWMTPVVFVLMMLRRQTPSSGVYCVCGASVKPARY